MRLQEIIRDLSSFEPGLTIYAAKPWNPASEAVVAKEPDSGGLPAEATSVGMTYFLEIFAAIEFLDGWRSCRRSGPSLEETCLRLIQYAMNDA